MGAIIGGIISEAIDVIGELREINRESVAAAVRKIATKIERGDVIPDEALSRAQERQAKIKGIRDSLPDAQ